MLMYTLAQGPIENLEDHLSNPGVNNGELPLLPTLQA